MVYEKRCLQAISGVELSEGPAASLVIGTSRGARTRKIGSDAVLQNEEGGGSSIYFKEQVMVNHGQCFHH